MSKYSKELKLKTIKYYYKGYSVEATANFYTFLHQLQLENGLKNMNCMVKKV